MNLIEKRLEKLIFWYFKDLKIEPYNFWHNQFVMIVFIFIKYLNQDVFLQHNKL